MKEISINILLTSFQRRASLFLSQVLHLERTVISHFYGKHENANDLAHRDGWPAISILMTACNAFIIIIALAILALGLAIVISLPSQKFVCSFNVLFDNSAIMKFIDIS
jgi:hypothetical protein